MSKPMASSVDDSTHADCQRTEEAHDEERS